jgi:sec-independent protein translocase protein TatA
MFKNLGTTEIIIIAVVLLVLFGGKKLPELARGLGQSGKELKKAKAELEKALTDNSKKNTT